MNCCRPLARNAASLSLRQPQFCANAIKEGDDVTEQEERRVHVHCTAASCRSLIYVLR